MNGDTMNVGREMAKGTGWMVAARFAVQGIGLVSTIVLARLLVPEDFGLVALATMVSAALQAMSEFSFDTVLIQNQRATRRHYDTAWTLSICRNAVLAAFVAAGAELIGNFFQEPRLRPIAYCLAVSLFIEGFQNIGIIDFRKNFEFRKDLIFMVLSKLGAFLVTVPMAFIWRNYWALIAGIMVGSALRVALSFAMHSYHPRFTFGCWRELIHFSKWLLLTNISGFLYNRSDTFVLGKFAGAQAIGVYSIAFEIANLASSNLLAPLRRAIFPGYAKISDDMEALRRGFVDVLALVTLVGMPIAAGIGAVAEPLVHVMLGTQWLASIPLIQIFSVYGFLGLINAGSSPIFLARSRPEFTFFVLGGSLVFMLPLLVLGVQLDGSRGVAIAITATSALAVAVDFGLVVNLLALPLRRVAAAIYRPAIASSLMVLAVLELQGIGSNPATIFEWIALLAKCVGGGMLVYPVVVLVLWTVAGKPNGAEFQIYRALLSFRGRGYKQVAR